MAMCPFTQYSAIYIQFGLDRLDSLIWRRSKFFLIVCARHHLPGYEDFPPFHFWGRDSATHSADLPSAALSICREPDEPYRFGTSDCVFEKISNSMCDILHISCCTYKRKFVRFSSLSTKFERFSFWSLLSNTLKLCPD